MTREKQGTAVKAKLDSNGHPIAVQVPDRDKRDEKGKIVSTAVRMGIFLLACFAHTGCEPEAQAKVDTPEVTKLDPRIETAVAEAQAAAKTAAHHATLAVDAAVLCSKAKTP